MTNSIIDRISRVVLGGSLIIATMSVSSAPLGGFAILPLIAIPIILSGIFGENPLGELVVAPFDRLKTRVARYIAKAFKHDTAAV